MTVVAALPPHRRLGHAWWPRWPLFWATMIGAAILLVVRRRDGRGDPLLDQAREVLAERYARGELTGEEYRERRDELQRHSP